MSVENTTTESAESLPNQNRIAAINTDREGNPLGATIFLSTEDIENLGMDSTENTISYRVENGELILSN